MIQKYSNSSFLIHSLARSCYTSSPAMKKIDFYSFSLTFLQEWISERGEPSFRAKQIFDWVYQKNILSFEEMTNLSHPLRAALSKAFSFDGIRLQKVQDSEDGETQKFLWLLSDGSLVESVLILSGDRRTVCVSSQVGCRARCAFCASGKEGWVRNLSSSEIFQQVLQIDRILKEKGEKVSHVVFMGMGEPLENYDAVISCIEKFNHPEMLGLSSRRITISTVGVVEGMKRLAASGLKVNLVLSLHAPNQHIRKKIIPYARKYPLGDILDAIDAYARKTKRDTTFEYILISKINDAPEHAEELARLLKGKQCTVNLIPYNPVPGLRLNRPERERIEAFRKILLSRRIPTTWRYTKGKDIAAACGQLALQKKNSGGKLAALG